MEKRALVAVVLMFFVLIIYNMLFLPKRRPPEPTDVREPKQLLEAQEAPDTARSEVRDIRIPVAEVPSKEVVVRTPLYTARFSSLGGVLTSFRLHRYLSSSDEPVELVPESEDLPVGVALLTQGGDRIDLSEADFMASAESLAIEDTAEVSLEFRLTAQQGLTVSKILRFRADSYIMRIGLEIAGPGAAEIRAIELGWQSGLQSTEANRKDDLRNFASLTLTGEGMVKSNLGKVKKSKEVLVGGDIKWSGVKTKYFFAGLVPVATDQAISKSFPGGEEAIGMTLEVDRPQPGLQEFLLYVGPLDYEGLKGLGLGLEKAVDFGWKWIRPVSRLMFAFMLLCNKAIPNYGLVIIVLSALTKLLFYPLTQKSFKSMREMQKVQPEMEAIKQKYKNDPQRLNKAIMELYRERGINPLGGCLPLMLQMPVFIALFNVLSRTIELRRAGFVLWIKDLSVPDVVARLPFALPFIGNAVSVLPILMGVAMFVQQKMSTSDPKQAMMTYMLPIVFTIMFFRFPSGLVLYWLVNNVLTIGHQYLMARAERLQEA